MKSKISYLSLVVILSFAIFLTGTAPPGNEAVSISKEEAEENDEIDVVEGILVEATANMLKLDIEGESRTFSLTNKSTFWRGGETDISKFQVDDSVMVRFNKNFVVERAWANLDRVQGWIESSLKNGYRVRVSRGEKPEVDIFIDERTVFENIVSQSKERVGINLSKGTFIDVIGLRLGDTLLGTLFFYNDPHQKKVEVEKVSEEVNSHYPLTTYTYVGYASWFNCPNGAGRCGTCRTYRSDQAAWPAMDSGCSSCSWTCCNCSKGCKNQVYLSCGNSVSVYDYCGSKTMTVYIADCGPNQISLCSRNCQDCRGYISPVIDLTKTTFAKFYDPATRGCFSCRVTR